MRELVCIVCPNGCTLKIDDTTSELNVTGAKCKKGVAFAKEELTCPKRSVTSTVATAFKAFPLLPVKTDGEIPKDKIRSVMQAINTVYVTEPVKLGEVIIENVLNTGVNIVSTITMPI
ncbi:MAG: DUF1667 domain-containing protein [Cellulosilyticaceae bacterium]